MKDKEQQEFERLERVAQRDAWWQRRKGCWARTLVLLLALSGAGALFFTEKIEVLVGRYLGEMVLFGILVIGFVAFAYIFDSFGGYGDDYGR